MSVQVYAGGVLAYDNRLPTEKRYTVQSILIEEIANKGGAATIILPPGHPAYDAFAPMKTLVEIYRNGRLRWRGRPLPVPEDVYGRRTVVCEGELCFLQDAIQRPYSYYGDPASVFTQIMDGYNAAVDPWKRFVVGDVTVSCENGFLALASTSAEKVSVTVNKLISQYGGLILFDSAEDGARRINWYADFPYTCNQQIRYGYNLIDYSSKPDATDFATRIIPYGAEGADGNRIKINANGKDYVENAEAVAKFGVIEKAVIYDGITDAAELQAKAEQDVGKLSDIPQTIHLTALDMSKLDIALDAFAMGQKVEASSAQHRLSGFYGITSLTEDLVNPSVGSVTLIREVSSHGNSIFTEQFTGLVTSKCEMESVAQSKVDAQTQADIFNKLTKNGEIQGLFMKDGQLYINASYLATGVIVSADGTVRLNLLNNTVEIDGTGTYSGVTYDTRIVLSADGIKGYTLDENGEEKETLSLKPGALGGPTFLTNEYGNGISILAMQGVATLGASTAPTCVDGAYIKVNGIGDVDATSEFGHVHIQPGKATLFSGTCAIGSTCSVPDTAGYDLFAVLLGDDSTTYPVAVMAYKVGDTIRGVGGWSGTDTVYKELYFFTATFSDETWTVVDAGVHDVYASGGISAGTKLSVKEIRGVV